MKILFAASEAHPLIKTGGLGDVAGTLPPALVDAGCEVRVLLPAYRSVPAKAGSPRVVAELPDYFDTGPVRLLETAGEGGVPVWLLDCPALFDRPGGPYTDQGGFDWPDNHLRFGLLGRVAAEIAAGTVASAGWRPDVLHLNDWQTGLAAAYGQVLPGRRIPTVLTVHNLNYTGRFHPDACRVLGLPPAMFAMDGVEFHGDLSFLKAGLFYADRITAVSPTYAREIMTPEFGCGFEGLLEGRARDVVGILNGVDYDAWNPATDPALVRTYSERRLADKAANRAALAAEFDLEATNDAPLFGVVSRLTGQKGIDFLLDALAGLVAGGGRLALVGSGERAFEDALTHAARRHPGRVGVRLGYDEDLAHRVMAGADALLVPSRFEPCGLTQLYALRYGTVPVVRRTGGLADTVADVSEPGGGTGIVFDHADAPSLMAAMSRAIALYRRPDEWQKIQRRGMRSRFTWAAAAERYLDLYRELCRSG